MSRNFWSAVQRFVERELRPLEDAVEETGTLAEEDARRIFERAKGLGLYAMNIPESLGGGGLSTVDWMLVEERFGHTTDILIGARSETSMRSCSRERTRRSAGSSSPASRASASFLSPSHRTRSGIRRRWYSDHSASERRRMGVDREKCYISDAHVSDFFVVTAVTDKVAPAESPPSSSRRACLGSLWVRISR